MLPIKSEERSPSFDDVTLFYKRFLRYSGLLPFYGRDFTYFGTRLLLAYQLACTVIYWSMITFYTVNLRKVPTIDAICETVVATGAILRYSLLTKHRSELADLLDKSQAIWELCDESGRHSIRRFEQKVRRVFGFLLGSCVLSNIMYSLTAVGLTLSANLLNDSQTKYLPFKWYTEDGPNLWPGYKITFPLQVLVVHNVCVTVSTVDSTGPLLIMIAAGNFRALRHRLIRISEYNEEELSKVDEELAACMRIHQRILKFCSGIEKLTKTIFLVQVLCTCYNLSLSGIKLAGTDPDRHKFGAVTLFQLIQLFICQWAPDHLLDESTAISTAAYHTSFNCMQRQLGKVLLLIMTRAQRPVQMTAAGIVDLSLENFNAMVTSAVSFFTVLRNFNI